jgi:hypothetical protein
VAAKIDTSGRKTWELLAPYASPAFLARAFPPPEGLSLDGWKQAVYRAKARFPDLPWVELRNGKRFEPPGPLPALPRVGEPDDIDRDVVVQRWKSRAQEAERKYREAVERLEQDGAIIDAMREAVSALEPAPPPKKRERRGRGRPETAVMLVSDYHIGERVSEEETGGLARYDFETFEKRWRYHVETVASLTKDKLAGYDIPRLQACMLGDMVSGTIHDELVVTADGTPMEWVVEGGHVIAQGLRDLAAEFEQVRVDCVVGNHGRLTRRPAYKQRYVNWDYLLYKFIELELRDQRNVEFTVPRSFWDVIEVEGKHVLNLHGDNIRAWNGIPWYGITRAVGNLSTLLASQGVRFDVVNLGHFHNAGALDRIGGELVLNGSAVGGNEYSIGALFTSNRPRQVLYGMHPEHCKTWSYAIDLTEGDTR